MSLTEQETFKMKCHKANCINWSDKVYEFIAADSFVAIAADKTSMDSLWFAPISKIDSVRNGKDADDCGHVILTGYTIWQVTSWKSPLSRPPVRNKHCLKKLLFYKKCIVYTKPCKKGFKLENDCTKILHFIE